MKLGTIQVLRHHVFDFFRPTHNEEIQYLNSFWISLISFGTFTGPPTYEQKTGKEGPNLKIMLCQCIKIGLPIAMKYETL